MKYEEINERLFKGKMSIKSIDVMSEIGLLPCFYSVEESEYSRVIAEWRDSFVGRFLYKYPRRYGIIKKIKSQFGKMPE